jgi:hypothetical protein
MSITKTFNSVVRSASFDVEASTLAFEGRTVDLSKVLRDLLEVGLITVFSDVVGKDGTPEQASSLFDLWEQGFLTEVHRKKSERAAAKESQATGTKGNRLAVTAYIRAEYPMQEQDARTKVLDSLEDAVFWTVIEAGIRKEGSEIATGYQKWKAAQEKAKAAREKDAADALAALGL